MRNIIILASALIPVSFAAIPFSSQTETQNQQQDRIRLQSEFADLFNSTNEDIQVKPLVNPLGELRTNIDEESFAKKKKRRGKNRRSKRNARNTNSNSGNNNSSAGGNQNTGIQHVPNGQPIGNLGNGNFQVIPHHGSSRLQPPVAAAHASDDFQVNIDQTEAAPGTSLIGAAQWGPIQNLLDEYQSIAGDGALYRLKMYTANPSPAAYPARHTRMAQESGMKVLLTVKGTPLSMASDQTLSDNLPQEYPPYARSMPVNVQEYADYVVELLTEFETRENVLPEYVEVWAEADHEASWSGTREEYLTLYGAVATAVRASFPSIKIGGAGLAGILSEMDGEGPALVALIDHAAANDLPLDFVSWHHYTIGAELRYNGAISLLRSRLIEQNLADAKLFCTEWNIYASANNNEDAESFDNHHAAANFVSFLATAADLGIDGNTYFHLMDADNQEDGDGIHDLEGLSTGASSWHGIKKPVFRAMEFMYELARETRLKVDHPEGELAASVIASQSRNRVRLIVANDIVDADWVWANGIREYGCLPGRVWNLMIRAGYRVGGPMPKTNRLKKVGMTNDEIDAVSMVLPEFDQARMYMHKPRHLDIQLAGAGNLNVSAIYRFDADHNNPVNHIDDIHAAIAPVEQNALDVASLVADSTLAGFGLPPHNGAIHDVASAKQLEVALSITENQAEAVWNAYRVTLAEERLSEIDSLNNLPSTRLQMETEIAEVQLNGSLLEVEMQPNSVMVIELTQ